MIAGGTHIDHADVLRAGSTAAVLGHRVMAPSTLGTFLRSFTFGHVRQLEAVNGRALERAWATMVGPVSDVVVGIDRRSAKLSDAQAGCRLRIQAQARVSPAARDPRGHRRGVACPDAERISEHSTRCAPVRRRGCWAGVRRYGANAQLTCRFDSGFWANDTIALLNRQNVLDTMAVGCSSKGINNVITAIPDSAWTSIEYTDDGEAQVAECAYTTGTGKKKVTRRLIVRRTASPTSSN